MQIIGFSGKKGAGKNTLAHFLFGMEVQAQGIVEWYDITDDGKLVAPFEKDGQLEAQIWNLDYKPKGYRIWAEENVWPYVKTYAFADPLKEFCMEVFGLSFEQCYGTDEQKNSLTDITWEDMPMPVMEYVPIDERRTDCLVKTGPMTAREVLQTFGTDVCRRMRKSCWVDATIRRIQEDKSNLAIVTDVRFPNEVDALKEVGANVFRLTRSIHGDSHESETQLDNYEFDHIIDNQNMDLTQSFRTLYDKLVEIGFIVEDDK